MIPASEVARKELVENILNGRMAAATVIGVVLVLTTVVVLMGDYEHKLRDYEGRVRQQEQFIDQFGHYNRLGWMSREMRPPSYLQVLVLGIDGESQQENFISNPVAALLARMDLVVIVTIIFSLVALLFSYDSLTGEREAGVLRQLLATGVSRRAILLGKYVGGLTSVLLPFSIAALAGFVAIAFNPLVQLRGPDFGVFAILLLLSWTTLAAMFGLGLLCSALSRTSGESVLKSLFVWILLVLVIPNISPFLAAEVRPIPSAAKIEQEKYRILDRERDEIVRARWRSLLPQYPDLAAVIPLPRPELEAKITADPRLRGRYETYSKEYEQIIRQVNSEQRAKAEKISETFRQRAAGQRSLAMTLTLMSPTSNFVLAATEAAETGIASEEYWQKQAGEYSAEVGKYAEARYRAELEKNPAYDSNDYLDLRQRPRFTFQPRPLVDRFEAVLPRFGLLAGFCLLFFAGAFFSFQRYDVR